MTPLHRVLVVEDHAPFRRVICELLQQRADVRIVGQAADGLDAVRQATVLRPDVVMLDVNLPVLSGLEAASRIRGVVPDAKLMFVTVESSLEVVEQAFSRGAHGYVYKPRAQRDVLTVLDAIIRGGRFVSGGLARIGQGDSLASHKHHLLFYSSDEVLVLAFARFIAGQLDEGKTVIVLLSEAHDERVRRSLQASHVDVALAIREKRYVPVSISDMLAEVMVNGRVDLIRFQSSAQELLADVQPNGSGGIAACGECAPTLWAQGNLDAAIQLEHLWDEVGKSRQMDILCAYPFAARDEARRVVRSLCAEHTTVEIS